MGKAQEVYDYEDSIDVRLVYTGSKWCCDIGSESSARTGKIRT